MEHFQGAQPDPLFLPLRAPGGEFWPQLREQDEKRRKAEELQENLGKIEAELEQLRKDEITLNEPPAPEDSKEVEEPSQPAEPPKTQEEISERRNELTEQKAKIEFHLKEQAEERLEVKYPPPVKEEDKLNLIIIGPEKSGRTTLANYLAQEHQRAIIRLDQIFDWCLKRGSALAEEAQKYLDARSEEYKEIMAEFEKKKKGKKPKGKEDEPEPDASEYGYLSKEILLKMIKERLAQEDSNAGAIFDCLESAYWKDLKTAVELIAEAVPRQNLQVMLFRFNKEGAEEEEMDVCTNYRYARRKLNPAGSKRDETKAQEAEAQESKKKTKKQGQAKGAKRGQAKAPTKEDDEKAADQLEAERKQKEEEDRKRQEEEARAMQKPKAYELSEIETYQTFIKEFEQWFGDLTVRLQGGGKPESQPAEDGEAAEEGEPEKQEEVEAPVEEKPEAVAQEAPSQLGKLILIPQNIEFDFKYLCESAKSQVPEPQWPDPDKEPLPPPVIHQIVKRPPTRPERKEITMFSIWTPLPENQRPPTGDGSQNPDGEAEAQEEKDKLPPMTKDQTRWVLEPKESKKLYVKFFS
mmetsp:Transcript_39618/g.60624  ORF Transcript_39618/g.60624 Transcript_39618/m.60624 type:complete len:579 (-) Transcript_39618:7106-8842(-)